MKNNATVLMAALACAQPGCRPDTGSVPHEALDERNSFESFGLSGTMTWDEIRTIVSADLGEDAWPYARTSHASGGIANRPDRWYALVPAGTTAAEPAPKTMHEQYLSFRKAVGDGPVSWTGTVSLSPAEKWDLLSLQSPDPVSAALFPDFATIDGDARFPEYARLRNEKARIEETFMLVFNKLIEEWERFVATDSGDMSPSERDAFLAAHSLPEFLDGIDIRTNDSSDPDLFFVYAPHVRERVERQFQERLLALNANDMARFEALDREAAQHSAGLRKLEDALRAEILEQGAPLEEAVQRFLAAHSEFSAVRRLERTFLYTAGYAPDLERLRDETDRALKEASRPMGLARMKMADRLLPLLPLTASGWRNWGRTYAAGDYAYAGHCHGESLAQLRMGAPKHGVRVKAALGGEVLFSKNDLAAIATVAWSNQATGTFLYAGQRCEQFGDEVARDADGRVADVACRDLNAGLFHMALVEKVAMKHEPIILDEGQMGDVWNQPVRSFSFKFQPVARKDGTLAPAGEPVPVEDVQDRFAAHRAPGTRYLVQVEASYSFVEPVSYSLELDENKRVIGGEWGPVSAEGLTEKERKDYHPDFLWTLSEDGKLGDGEISPRVLERLFECARQDGAVTDSSVVGLESGEPVEFVDCELW